MSQHHPNSRRRAEQTGARQQYAFIALAVTTALILLLLPTPRSDAADHRDGPIITDINAGPFADVNDVYLFLDPNDNSKVIVTMSVNGFIVPAFNAHQGVFDSTLRYRFQVENTGDAQGDLLYDITFTRQDSRDSAQTATIKENGRVLFTAPTTVSSATATTAPDPVVTTDSRTGISFFAGLMDDPFFFDMPAGLRYLASRFADQTDPRVFDRARDSFAGYNATMVVLSIPAARLRGPAGDLIGLAGITQRGKLKHGGGASSHFHNVDRMGIPAVNEMLIPFLRKGEYNAASTEGDVAGEFASDIARTLSQLQTDSVSIGIFESLVVRSGDMLRLNLAIPNRGPEGGNNPEAIFPNGRRPHDDVMDRLITLINNRAFQGDNVNANDVEMRSAFPFFAPPNQPFPAGAVDDRTRN